MRKSDYQLTIYKNFVHKKNETELLGYLPEVEESKRIPFSSVHVDNMRDEIDHMVSVGAVELMQLSADYMNGLVAELSKNGKPSTYRNEIVGMLHDIDHVTVGITDKVRMIEFDDKAMHIAPHGIRTRFAEYVGDIVKVTGNGTSQKTVGIRVVIDGTTYDIATKDGEIVYKTINFPLLKRKYIEPTITACAHKEARRAYLGNRTASADVTYRLRRVASGAME